MLNTITHYNGMASGFDRIASSMNGLESEFRQVAPSTDLDKAQLDVMIASAQNMIDGLEALKLVPYEPPTEGG